MQFVNFFPGNLNPAGNARRIALNGVQIFHYYFQGQGGAGLQEVVNVRLLPTHIDVADPDIGHGAIGAEVTDPDILLVQPMELVAFMV